jgi:hypothetical protein
MKRILDCLVNYFGLDEEGRPTYRRYFCYHVVAGPGPTPEAGVASVTTLAVHDDGERCTYCRPLHTVEAGGPAAALEEALRYLDSYHERDRLRKMQSDIRGPQSDRVAEAAPSPERRASASRGEETVVEPVPLFK